MAAALAKYRENENKPVEERLSGRAIAQKHGVDKENLRRRVKGIGASIYEFNAMKQKAMPTEEQVLLDLILLQADRGFPLTCQDAVEYMNVILLSRGGQEIKPKSNWIENYLVRHRDILQAHWSKPLDTQHAKALNPAAVQAWFELLSQFVVDLDIRPEDTYGMDESGFPPSDQGTQRVLGCRGTKTQHKQGGADRENGQNIMAKWGENNISDASICISPNGWTDSELALEWLTKDFDATTHEKAAGRQCLLLLNGHNSHHSLVFLEYANENNIIILGYPPHCTHALQGLDVICFAKMKNEWKKVIHLFEQQHQRKVGKGDFTELFGQAYKSVFDPETIKAAFQVTGVHPFNNEVITAQQMKPSEPTSIKGAFPLLQPSPVRAVMAAFHHYKPTAVDLDPETYTAAPSHSLSTQSAGPPPIEAFPTCFRSSPRASLSDWSNRSPSENYEPRTQPSTPLHHVRDPNIDPSLYTPSKWMRMITGALSLTSSGSFLVQPDIRITSRHTIAPLVLEGPPDLRQPDWSKASMQSPSRLHHMSHGQLIDEITGLRTELDLAHQHVVARDGIIEGAHATMVIQNMFVEKQSISLNTKENEKPKNNTKVSMKGKGRHLTGDEFRTEVEDVEKAKKKKETDKEKKKNARESAKNARGELETRWQVMKAAHAADVEAWTKQCEQLRSQGVKRKDLPDRPPRVYKPKLNEMEGEEEEDNNDESNDGSGGEN